MTTVERARTRAAGRWDRIGRELADEFRNQRLAAGWSQAMVAAGAGLSRPRYTRVENARCATLTVDEAVRITVVLGLDLSVRVYPGAGPRRDAAHAERLNRLLRHVVPPLRAMLEVPLPARDGAFEQRAWDAVIEGDGGRTVVELEMRVRDGQALARRLALKVRDDPPDAFVLVLADTIGNRRVLREDPTFFPELPRLGPVRVARALASGQHPPSSLIVL